ncbi:MAG: imidazoleglycerol-phosphate dehydratase HisB [Bacteroidia bacterium]|nr:imidazoleglycerol-phosphate dehydratase HisB [Bacteroidia bacterium]
MRYLFIDRDGTLIEEPPDTQQVDSYERFRLLPGVLSVLRWAQRMGYRLVMITNQDGLGTDAFPEEAFWGPHNLLLDICSAEGISWEGIHIDRSRADAPSHYRKPSPLLLLPYLSAGIDRERSFVIGDRPTDMELAHRMGLRGLWLSNAIHGWGEKLFPEDTVFPVRSWSDIQQVLMESLFQVLLRRETRETQVEIYMALYGRGKVQVATGIGFLDHMLELLAYHAGWNLSLQAKGDLHVDYHHTIEDIAIVLGQALRKLQADKRGICRYGQSEENPMRIQQVLPMDEALALVAVDLSGRGTYVGHFHVSESVGGIPASLWAHFFETLAREAAFSLHVRAEGKDAHHIIEAIFKGLGRSLRQAFRRDYEDVEVPSTKGLL